MGWLSDVGHALDPTGDNFLGLGKTAGRVLGSTLTFGFGEFNRPDPFGVPRQTAFSKGIGGATTGALTGAGVGFVTGGPFGAIVGAGVGAAGGAAAGITGATNNYTPLGFAKNVGIGVGAGLVGGGASYLLAPKLAATSAAKTIPVFTETLDATGTAAATGATVATASGGTWGTLGTLALLNFLNRPSGQPPTSADATIPTITVGQGLPGNGPGIYGSTPGAILYPSIPTDTGFSTSALAPASLLSTLSSPTGFFVFTVAAAIFFFFVMKKKR